MFPRFGIDMRNLLLPSNWLVRTLFPNLLSWLSEDLDVCSYVDKSLRWSVKLLRKKCLIRQLKYLIILLSLCFYVLIRPSCLIAMTKKEVFFMISFALKINFMRCLSHRSNKMYNFKLQKTFYRKLLYCNRKCIIV